MCEHVNVCVGLCVCERESVSMCQSCQRETLQTASDNGDPGWFWSQHVGRVPGEHVVTVS